MQPTRSEQVKSIFKDAIDVPVERRAAFLDQTTAHDTALRREVEELLRYESEAEEWWHASLKAAAPIEALDQALGLEPGEAPVPQTLGTYEIEALLGRGGTGVVYRARQGPTGALVALKVLRPGVVSRAARSRFTREIQVLRNLDHPAIPRLVEAGVFESRLGQQPYLALEFVEGETLREYLRHNAPATRDRLELLAKICDIVQFAHDRDIVHRDLKPENILIDTTGQPKVLDFGLAQLRDTDLRVTTYMTGLGQIIGTIQYMSPEQCLADSGDIDARSDVYALGVLGYEMLTGQLPYELSGDNVPKALHVILTRQPVPAGSIRRELKGNVEAILQLALEKRPADRYSTAAALAADLRRATANKITVAHRYAWRRKFRRLTASGPRRLVLVTAMMAPLVLAAIVVSNRNRALSPEDLAQLQSTILGASRRVHAFGDGPDGWFELPKRRETIVEAIHTFESAQHELDTHHPIPATQDLSWYINWRLGESHYFLGQLDHNLEQFEAANLSFAKAGTFARDQPHLPQFEDQQLVQDAQMIYPHLAWTGVRMAHRAIADYRTPHTSLSVAFGAAGRARDAFAQYRVVIPEFGDLSDPVVLGKTWFFGCLLIDLGETATALGFNDDNQAFLKDGLDYFRGEYLLIDNERKNVGARGAFWHGFGVAYLRRAQSQNSLADTDSAESCLRKALETRTVTVDYGEFTATRRRMAEVELTRARLTANPAESLERLRAALRETDAARRAVPQGSHPFEWAWTDLLRTEILVDQSRAMHEPSVLVQADSLLGRLNTVFSPEYSVPCAEMHLQRARALAVRSALAGDVVARSNAVRELDLAQQLLPADESRRFARRVGEVRQALEK